MNAPDSLKNAKGRAASRYRLNLFLFVVFMICLAVWFERQLHMYVTEILLVSGTLTLWGFWQIVQSWLRWGWDEETGDLRKRLLGQALATEYLSFGFVLIAFLWFTTSSIYVTYEGNAKGQDSYTVQVLREGNLYLPPLELTSYQRVAGRPFFLSWHSLDLEFRIVEPPGYDGRKERLTPWGGIHLRVPADFQPRKFRILRLVPIELFNDLRPASVESADVRYNLVIRLANSCEAPVAADRIFRVEDLRRQALYIGAEEADLRWLLDHRDKEKFRESFFNDLAGFQVPEARRAEWFREWEGSPRLIAAPVFGERDPVCIQIWREGQPSPRLRKHLPALSFPTSIVGEYLIEGAS